MDVGIRLEKGGNLRVKNYNIYSLRFSDFIFSDIYFSFNHCAFCLIQDINKLEK